MEKKTNKHYLFESYKNACRLLYGVYVADAALWRILLAQGGTTPRPRPAAYAATTDIAFSYSEFLIDSNQYFWKLMFFVSLFCKQSKMMLSVIDGVKRWMIPVICI